MAAICFICHLTEQDKITYGAFLSKSRLSVHYFCLLLSTNLVQNGLTDNSGICRFLIGDIKRYVQTIANNICSFCGEGNASVHCATCRIVFHQVCGAKHGCLYEFQDSFLAYCPKHVNIQEEPYAQEERCIICEDRLPAKYVATSVVPSCCNRGWSHIHCVRRYALNAGYYFNCFLCRNTDYKTMVRLRGVYVPDRDATWELETGAYMALEIPQHSCDVSQCVCELGRQHETNTGDWRMLLCASCGCFGMHANCAKSANIHLIEGTFNCDDCKTVLDKTTSLSEDVMDTVERNSVCVSDTSSSACDRETAMPTEISVMFVESDPKSNNNSDHSDHEFWSYEMAKKHVDNLLSTPAECPETCFSDTSSSLGDGVSSRTANDDDDTSDISLSADTIENLLSTPAECPVTCISDTSSSLGDGESRRRMEVDEVIIISDDDT